MSVNPRIEPDSYVTLITWWGSRYSELRPELPSPSSTLNLGVLSEREDSDAQEQVCFQVPAGVLPLALSRGFLSVPL